MADKRQRFAAALLAFAPASLPDAHWQLAKAWAWPFAVVGALGLVVLVRRWWR